jgi:LysM repeat protein
MKAFFILSLSLASFALTAQESPCEPSRNTALHTVQKGETLYGIARAYKISVDDLCKWNNMRPDAVLPQCITLWIKPSANAGRTEAPVRPTEYNSPPETPIATPTAPQKAFTKQNGNQHVVQPGETIDGLARLYGYTSERFRNFNNLGTSDLLPVGAVLRSTDCVCPGDAPPVSGSQPDRPTSYSTPTTAPATPAASDNNVEMPYTVERARRQDDVWGQNQTAGHEERETAVAKMNEPPKANVDLGKKPEAYLKKDELQMVAEINLMRTNPKGYIQHVEAYIAFLRESGDWSPAISTAYELIDELNATPALTALLPVECIYRTAQKHGADQQKRGYAGHDGSDGSWPWDRVVRDCPQMKDGNQNLISGVADPRRAIIMLLVDDGIEARGHRKMLLNPDWKYIACHKVGTIGTTPNCWIQMFGM